MPATEHALNSLKPLGQGSHISQTSTDAVLQRYAGRSRMAAGAKLSKMHGMTNY